MTLAVGQAVMFGEPNGSLGRITQFERDRVHVRWSYGVDARGEQVGATSRWIDPRMLIPIDEELLKQYEATRFNHEDRERSRLRNLIVESARRQP